MPPRTKGLLAALARDKGKKKATTSSSGSHTAGRIEIPQSLTSSSSSSPSSNDNPDPMVTSDQEEQRADSPIPLGHHEAILERRLTFIASPPVRERGLRLRSSPLSVRFFDSVAALGWESFITPPSGFHYEYVREFYMNLPRMEDGHLQLFGHDFYCTPAAIRDVTSVPEISPEDDLFYHLEYETLAWPTREEIIATLTMGHEPVWYQKSTFRFQCGSLCGEARLWWLFIRGKIMGNRSKSDVTTTVQNLLFCIVTRRPFDVASFIFRNLETLQTSLISGYLAKSSVGYPCLISDMCRHQHIPLPENIVSKGKAVSTLRLEEAKLESGDIEPCFDWHQRYYGGRGTPGWQEPRFLSISQGEEVPVTRPHRRRRVESVSHSTPSEDSWATQLQALTDEFHGFRMVSREDIYAVHHRVDRIDETVNQIRADQLELLQELRTERGRGDSSDDRYVQRYNRRGRR